MAELTIRPDEIRDALAEFVQAYQPDAASAEEVGTVAECGAGWPAEPLPRHGAHRPMNQTRETGKWRS